MQSDKSLEQKSPLKPCPFCGSTSLYVGPVLHDVVAVVCWDCSAQVRVTMPDDPNDECYQSDDDNDPGAPLNFEEMEARLYNVLNLRARDAWNKRV